MNPSQKSSLTKDSNSISGNKETTKWKKLLSALRKTKHSDSGPSVTSALSSDTFSFKHSHNCSNSYLRAGISNMKGYKKANQDRVTAFSSLEGDPETAFFGIYDGHGGTGVSNFLKDHLHEYILSQNDYKAGHVKESIAKAFLEVDDELRGYGLATELTGSTATILLIKRGDLIVAHLGDSRVVASVNGLVKPLTTDHNTSNPKERERVLSMGGNIKDNRVGGVLIPTRSFGDFLLKSESEKPAWKQIISAIPQIESYKLDEMWDFILVGTDGVWDAMNNSEIVHLFKSKIEGRKREEEINLSSICEDILDVCCNKNVRLRRKNSCDNMTLIIIIFDHEARSSYSVVSSLCISR